MIILKWAKKFNKGENGDFNMREKMRMYFKFITKNESVILSNNFFHIFSPP